MTTTHEKLMLFQVVDTAAEIVKEFPEKVVEGSGCVYVSYKHVDTTDKDTTPEHGRPGCLVGHVLYRLGWSLTELNSFDQGGISNGDQSSYLDDSTIRTLIESGHVEAEPAAAEFLSVLQQKQDDRWPWLDAFRAAEEAVNV